MYTYLIVDDEPLTRKGTRKKLEPLGDMITCIGEAENGQEALDFTKAQNPDIIITDMNMPVLDGTRLLPLLTKYFPKKPIIVISGYKDFEYTKQAINANAVSYILKPFGKEEIQQAVRKTITLLENEAQIQNRLISSQTECELAYYDYDVQTLTNMILGYHLNSEELYSEKIKSINQTHNWILMTLHSVNSLKNTLIPSFLDENGFGDLALYLQHTHPENLAFIILFIPQQSIFSVEQLCKQIVRNLILALNNANINASIGISSLQNNLKQLHEAYLETVSALNGKSPAETNNSYTYSNLSAAVKPIHWCNEEEMLFRMEAGMVEDLTELMEKLFLFFDTQNDFTIGDYKFYCYQLNERTKMFLTYYTEQVQPNTFSNSIQTILNSIFTLEELKSYYTQLFINIAEFMRGKSIYSTDNTIEKIKLYVDRNYQHNLTLEFISSLFYMNRSYCSHLFKEKTGQKFVDYMNHVRIEKAKKLLLNSDKKMYQIAKSIGYDNVKYFFRIFKKYENMTPEQYRNEMVKTTI